jgi:folate-binding protein YgfZ
MNKEWEKFLLNINATIENDTVKNFGLSIEEEQTAYSNLVLADLSHYALIEASGDDVIEFLQGQLTNDIKLVTESSGQLSAYCNPKGRILANFRIFKRQEHYFLRMRSDIAEATLKRLRMFVMRSKVELVDRSDELVRIGIAGAKATNNKALWQKLQKDAVAMGENSWNLLTIRAGIPEIVLATVEAFVPQMVNLQAINSLSFTKGCYPGQEVVARMHYLGKLKRRLFIGSVKRDTIPTSGQSIMSNDESEQKVGQIVTASWSKDKGVELLAVLQIEKAEKDELHIESNSGSTIQFIDLPYSLEIEDSN